MLTRFNESNINWTVYSHKNPICIPISWGKYGNRVCTVVIIFLPISSFSCHFQKNPGQQLSTWRMDVSDYMTEVGSYLLTPYLCKYVASILYIHGGCGYLFCAASACLLVLVFSKANTTSIVLVLPVSIRISLETPRRRVFHLRLRLRTCARTHRCRCVDYWQVVAVDERWAQGTKESGAQETGRDWLLTRQKNNKSFINTITQRHFRRLLHT